MEIDNARRNLLKTGVGIGSTVMLASACSKQRPALPAIDVSPDWQPVRDLFDWQHQAPLNAANLTPAYRAVLETQQSYAQRISADVSFINRKDFVSEELEHARSVSASMLGLKPDELAFVRNTSEGNAIVVSGLDLKPSDEVLLWNQNHATNYRSWHYEHQRRPFAISSVELPAQPQEDHDLITPFLKALNEHTAVVSVSHISNISGMRLPLRPLCKAIKQKRPDVHIHIDGAQSWGCVDLDLSIIDCDSYTAPAHKWLCGPRGVGILAIKGRAASRLQPLQNSYDFQIDYPAEQIPETARRFECLGQRDTAAVAAVATAVEQHQAIGMQRIESRVAELTQYALAAFQGAGIETATPQNPQFGHAVVVADLGGKLKAIGAFLATHNAGFSAAFVHGNKVHCDPAGGHHETDSPTWLRLCPHIYNSKSDIDAAVAIAQRVKESNVELAKEALKFL